ncbi:hypothetical protein HanIR_Chr07g0334181 [Helianthus annuus]|nr:hypothetical protein HanIR_Chr07g0334181 [Helianthus annuus]
MYVCIDVCVLGERREAREDRLWADDLDGAGTATGLGVVFLGRRREDGPGDGAHTIRSDGHNSLFDPNQLNLS